MRFLCRTSVLLGILLLIACAEQSPSEPRFVTTPVAGVPNFLRPTMEAGSYPASTSLDASAYPVPSTNSQPSTDGRNQSALTSYKLALELAKKEYDPNSQLYAIVPSNIMIGNLGSPPVLPGWFYKFKLNNSRREFIVQVVDTAITGSTQAESIEELRPAELPIDVSQLKIDSPQVLAQFKEFAAKHSISSDNKVFDLELVSLEGGNGPVWSVIDPMTKQWLYSISAITGVEVPNPHQ